MADVSHDSFSCHTANNGYIRRLKDNVNLKCQGRLLKEMNVRYLVYAITTSKVKKVAISPVSSLVFISTVPRM